MTLDFNFGYTSTPTPGFTAGFIDQKNRVSEKSALLESKIN